MFRSHSSVVPPYPTAAGAFVIVDYLVFIHEDELVGFVIVSEPKHPTQENFHGSSLGERVDSRVPLVLDGANRFIERVLQVVCLGLAKTDAVIAYGCPDGDRALITHDADG